MKEYDVIVLGAGISGLVTTKLLNDKGLNVCCIEKTSTVGGRICSEKKDGFTLDKGFQVYLSAYDEPKPFLDFKKLDFKSFNSGAYLCSGGKKHIVADPRKQFILALKSLKTLPFNDLWLLNKLQIRLKSKLNLDIDSRFTTLHFLKRFGFSDQIINRFFIPFLGGVFLENELKTPAELACFYLFCFFQGEAVIPKFGMQEIPNQIASSLTDQIKLKEAVLSVKNNQITTSNNQYNSRFIISALDYASANKLFDLNLDLTFNSTICMYFSADRVKDDLPILF